MDQLVTNKSKHAKIGVDGYKHLSELRIGDILYRKKSGEFLSLREILHMRDEKKQKLVNYYSFDGFVVSAKVMNKMFECETFNSEHEGRRLKIYKYV